MTNDKYFLGVDVGGTKSHALITDKKGRALGMGADGAGNYESVGYEGLKVALQNSVGQALKRAKITRQQVSGAGFGIAGYDWPAEHEATRQAIKSLGLTCPCAFVNDTLIGLIAGASAGWGIAIVAGTGNNCWGRDQQGREGRITGRGGVMGEYGGSAEIVARAVQAVARAWTRRDMPTKLTQTFIKLTGARSAEDLLEGISLNRYQLSAANAPAVFQCARQGDAVARSIIRWAGQELGGSVLAVARQLNFIFLGFEVVMTGSLFKVSPELSQAMMNTVHAKAPLARFVPLTAPPVTGGVLLGMEQAGLNTVAIRSQLTKKTQAVWDALQA
jgi:N-acetylglucosamine kinase-like BadF-type ATPase